MRKLLRALASAAALLSVLAFTPQSLAQGHASSSTDVLVPGTGVGFSENGARDARTRAIAAENPAAVSVTATLCGSGYVLEHAEPLPDARRFGTLFTYTKYATGVAGACAVFDNNTTTAKRMKLKLCPNKIGAACKVDEGTYSQYAGPVKGEGNPDTGWGDCSRATAIMWSDGVAIIDRVIYAGTCD
ncbi:hypothetical protein LUX12_10620 [Streptomyces somaliensis]|uniref:hypothetical protein n=1 Tax=Streptomyces somaliensis TaxID=78355 RepID=UPI0020CBDCF7|nr:hypothetical protein [Streptomyces somaliensis]MCP9945127.1 hypothetical protein [Streptomyces somaliensis]MCP9961650.1 hypothetical protein [Streptomyces somaliensis]MCP9974468.1 hypothetical protein [Streptomyces somaliensis]